METSLTVSAWFAVVLAIPVLLLGEWLVRRVRWLLRFNIPTPVVGGLLISLLMLAGNLSGLFPARFQTSVTAPWWTWLVTVEPDWRHSPARNVNLPLLVAFFTCIGLNASWTLIKRGSGQVLLFLLLAGTLAILQNALGLGLARLLDVSPLLGIVCGSVTMTGGHGTAMGFAADIELAGLPNATVVGVAAATFGLVAGGLLGGPLGGALIRKHGLASTGDVPAELAAERPGKKGILGDFHALARWGKVLVPHALLLLACVKLGTWASYFIQQTQITFPVYIGAMLLGVLVRNISDLAGARWIQSDVINGLASVTLGLFLAIAMMSLNLIELANTALPMLIILMVQTGFVALFAWCVTFRVMGRDFDAAIMAGGHCGFGLGATPNAIANMKALVERFGPAPRAFLVVPIVGAFLIDFINALNITFFLNWAKS